jgi:cytochrome P450
VDVQEIFNALLAPEGMDDPYPLYAAMHEHGPVIQAGGGMVLVPGYEVASAVLRDQSYLVPDAAYLDEISPGWRAHPSLDTDSLLTLNGETHARIRSLMAKAFTRRRIAELEPAVVRLTDGLLDSLAESGAGGEVDFMQEFAFALPVTVICELIGVPAELRAEFRPLARALTLTLEPLVDEAGLSAADEAALKLAGMFAELITERRARPADDLLSAILTAADAEEGRISENELLQNLILLLVAGFETTTNLLGNGVRVVLDDPAAGAALRSFEVTPQAFVEEVLRYDSPVQFTEDRRPTRDVEVGGVTVRAGEHLVVLIGAANRDPRRFLDPDRFWPLRPDAGPISFGGGAHFCMGAALARLEGTVAFPRLFARFPDLALAGSPERRWGIVLRGFEHLPVTLGASLSSPAAG